jgi:hypothetical protein
MGRDFIKPSFGDSFSQLMPQHPSAVTHNSLPFYVNKLLIEQYMDLLYN